MKEMKSQIKTLLKPLVAGMLCGVLLTSSVLTVSAASMLRGNNRNYSEFGINYVSWNEIRTGRSSSLGPYASAMMNVQRVNPSTAIPGGYAGVRARLYRSNGTLERQSDWVYNGFGDVGIGITAALYNVPTNRAYYANGLTLAVGTSGGVQYSSFPTLSLMNYT